MAEPLKNMFNTRLLTDLATALQSAYPAFDSAQFMRLVCDDHWEDRALKARVRHITTVLHDILPADYPIALTILREAAPQLTGYNFETIIFPDFVEVYGVPHWDESMAALEQFTQQSTAEAAIRPFIRHDQDRGMAQMLAWSKHPNEHLRRLASEGCRPRLPWHQPLRSFIADPAPILPILDNLKNDPSEYVRRSVANNLNDIAKDHPEIVVHFLRGWQPSYETKRIIRHALRTLIKEGDPAALALLGYDHKTAVEVKNLIIEPAEITLGENITFAFEITSQSDAPQELVIDYVIYFMKANGKRAPKVFKLTTKTLAPGETLILKKRHPIKPITTRQYYAGEQGLAVKINGTLFGEGTFTLLIP